MKNFKLSIVLIVILFTRGLSAQETSVDLFSIPLSNPSAAGKLIVNQLSGSIDVVAYNGNEVVIKASFKNKKEHYGKEHKRDGMKKIQNSSLDISAEEKNNVVRVINEQWNKVTNLEIKVPKNFSLKLSTVNDGNIYVEGVNGEMEISNVNGEITLKSVSGSASMDTVNGDIKADFNSISSDANMAFSSLNGDLHITFPNSLKADVKAKSDMGDIYTDFDMQVSANKAEVNKNNSSGTYKVKIEQWVRGTINGGGPEMLFKTFNGDILIKSK